MSWRVRSELRRAVVHPRAPLITLAVILAASLGARALYLGEPCSAPCRSGTDHGLIFDEAYYVNAARVIAGIHPPAGAPYATAPLGRDPNAEHPQLAKLIIAGTVELLGDDPWGWRLGSIVFGLIALLAMYGLVRAARGSPWLAVGATGVMALDNLALLHGRIATLDIYFLAMTLIAATLYLRDRPWPAGVALGIGACMKLVALAVAPAFVLLELFAVLWARGQTPGPLTTLRARARPVAVLVLTAGVVLVLGVWGMDLLVPGYDPASHATYAGSAFTHIGHMLSVADQLKAIPNATGISSTPWQWLVNQTPIDYARVAVNSVAGGKIVASRAVFDARGEVNPFIIFLAIPALFSGLAAAWYERDRVAALGASWCVATFLVFVIQADGFDRLSYLYYMLLVLPGVYVLTARLFSPGRVPRTATLGWALALVYGFVELYPIHSLNGH